MYNKIIQLNEKSTAALIAMGHCFAMLEDNYRALQSYKQALNITPESQVTIFKLIMLEYFNLER